MGGGQRTPHPEPLLPPKRESAQRWEGQHRTPLSQDLTGDTASCDGVRGLALRRSRSHQAHGLENRQLRVAQKREGSARGPLSSASSLRGLRTNTLHRGAFPETAAFLNISGQCFTCLPPSGLG